LQGHGKDNEKMTPAQKEIFHVIEAYWNNYGFGPTIEDIMFITGERGRGNVARKMAKLIEIGVCKGNTKMTRSIRPAYINLRKLNG
jgi:SOS-response transcriptional repressor LexA